MKYLILLYLVAIPFHSCSNYKIMEHNQKLLGHSRLYSYPEFDSSFFEFKNEADSRYQRLSFISFNDLNSQIQELKISIIDQANKTEQYLKVGGLEVKQKYISILKKQLENFHLISHGSLFSQPDGHKEVINYLNKLNIDIASVGHQDLEQFTSKENALNQLDQSLRGANFPIVLSNAFDLQSNKSFKFNNILSSFIKEQEGIKIGYFSLLGKSNIEAISTEKLNKVYFEDLLTKSVEKVRGLKKDGAQVIIALIDEPIDCTTSLSKKLAISKYKVNFDQNISSVCNNDSLIVKLINQLPPNYIDVIFTSSSDTKVANFINATPVLQSYHGMGMLNWINLYYDKNLKKINTSKTQIMQPLMLCHKFYDKTKDCFYHEDKTNINLIRASFLDTEI